MLHFARDSGKLGQVVLALKLALGARLRPLTFRPVAHHPTTWIVFNQKTIRHSDKSAAQVCEVTLHKNSEEAGSKS